MISQDVHDQYPPMATGHFDAWVAVTSAKQDAVRALLPDHYDLVPQSVAPAGEHPLVILAGRQTDVQSRFVPQLRLSYLEAGVMIPWVQCPDVGSNNSSLFRAMLILDSELPTFLGRLLGISKRTELMARDYTGMQVQTESKATIFSARFRPQSPFTRFASIPNFASIRSLFEQIHVGRSLGTTHLPTVCIWCNLHLHRAIVRPVTAKYHVDNDFCSAKSGDFRVPAIKDGAFGAFQLRTSWSMRCLRSA